MPIIEERNIDDLIPYVRNSRTHSDEQVAALAGAIDEFGLAGALIVRDGVIAKGHGTLMAIRKLIGAGKRIYPAPGRKAVPAPDPYPEGKVPVLDASGWSETQFKAFVIADNKLAEKAGWDDDILAIEIGELTDLDFDLELIGFEDWDLDLGEGEEPEPELNGDPEEVPEPPAEPITKPGDIWVLGRHRVMCGDSTDAASVALLMDGKRADVLFTDPPYGYKYESNYQKKHKMLLNDDVMLDFMPSAFAAMCENSAAYICGSFQSISKWIDYVSKHMDYKNLIVWKKNNWSMGDLKGSFAGQHELIIFAHKGRVELIGKRDPDVWSFDRSPPENHPTQKPVEMIEYALSKVKSGCVLDLFGGSGSTLIACEKTNRQCLMMELSPQYCDVIVTRWQTLTGQTAIHAHTGQPFTP